MRAIVSDQRLVAAAGQVPLLDWQTNGTSVQTLALDPAAIAVGAPRTVYTVYWVGSTASMTAVSNPVTMYGNDANNANLYITRYNLPNGSNQWLFEARNSGSASTTLQNTPNTMQCHIGGLNASSYVWEWNGSQLSTGTTTCALNHSKITTVAPVAATTDIQTKGQRTVIFSGVHAVATMRQVRDWLLRSTNLS